MCFGAASFHITSHLLTQFTTALLRQPQLLEPDPEFTILHKIFTKLPTITSGPVPSFVMPPPVGKGTLSIAFVRPSVRLSVVYIAE